MAVTTIISSCLLKIAGKVPLSVNVLKRVQYLPHYKPSPILRSLSVPLPFCIRKITGLGFESALALTSSKSLNLPEPHLEKKGLIIFVQASQDYKNKMIDGLAWLCSVLSVIALNPMAT